MAKPVPPASGQFKKGQSGNPGGQHRLTKEVRALAQQYNQEAVLGLVEIARNAKEPAAARVAAWREVLDRANGKPTQAMEHSGPDGEPLPTSIAITFVKPDAGD